MFRNNGDTRLVKWGLISVALAMLSNAAGLCVVLGDVIKLKESGEVRGVVKSPAPKGRATAKPQADEKAAPNEVVIETLSGGEIAIEPEQVVFITKRPRVLEEYDSSARHVADTVEARWQLAEWCRLHGLTEPRHEQLAQILELDPEHKQAHYGLGHRRQGNRWINPQEADAELLASGYVRYKGRMMTTLERDQLELGEARQQEQNEWRPKIKLWFGWLNARDPRKQSDAVIKFRELRDVDAVPAVVDLLLADNNVEVRRLAVQVLAQIGGAGTVFPLARCALSDADHLLQETAFNAIDKDHRAASEPIFLRALRDESNPVVRRAAVLLARIGLRSAVPALFEALTTSHKTRVAVQQGINSGFNRDGSPSGSVVLPPEIEAAMRAGQLPYGVQVHDTRPPPPVKWVTIRRPVQNAEVLEALRKLTSEDFGYDKRAWRLWWQSQSK